MTEIDGLDIHFIHVRSKHEDALPLIVTHGWPGSVIEQLKIIDLLTDPTAHGASASDAFHVVIPSMPGYGFSGRPTSDRLGPGPHRARLGGADEAPRLRAVRGVGRRLGRGRRRLDGGWRADPAAASRRRRAARDPHQHGPAWFRRTRRRRSLAGGAGAVRSLSRGATRRRAAARFFTSTSRTRASWGRARRRCTGWRTHLSAWPPSCSTTPD